MIGLYDSFHQSIGILLCVFRFDLSLIKVVGWVVFDFFFSEN